MCILVHSSRNWGCWPLTVLSSHRSLWVIRQVKRAILRLFRETGPSLCPRPFSRKDPAAGMMTSTHVHTHVHTHVYKVNNVIKEAWKIEENANLHTRDEYILTPGRDININGYQIMWLIITYSSWLVHTPIFRWFLPTDPFLPTPCFWSAVDTVLIWKTAWLCEGVSPEVSSQLLASRTTLSPGSPLTPLTTPWSLWGPLPPELELWIALCRTCSWLCFSSLSLSYLSRRC